jgi:predicted secreted Zn-dependent protease
MISSHVRRLAAPSFARFLPLLVAALLFLPLLSDPANHARLLGSLAVSDASGAAPGGAPAVSDDGDSDASASGRESEASADTAQPAGSAQTAPGEPSQVRVTTVNQFYDVDGTDLRSVLASIRQHGPHDADGAWAASTSWTFTWAYRPTLSDGCRVESATVDLHLTFTYPHWATSDTLVQPAADDWTRYMTNVETHEAGHAQIAQAAAADLAQALETVPAQASCDDLTGVVDTAARDHLARHARSQLEYDRETLHGVAQGATLSFSQ